jgi:hypothetical protein
MSPTTVFLMMLETTLHSVGEFFKEIAVLTYVFVPLDLWKDKKIEIGDAYHLAWTTAATFTIGLAIQWASNLVQRSREIWEVEEDLI